MIKVTYPRFRGMTGKGYPKSEQIFERQVPLDEAISRLLQGDEPNCFNCLLAGLIQKGAIPAVFERNGELYPLNLECYMRAQVYEEATKP